MSNQTPKLYQTICRDGRMLIPFQIQMTHACYHANLVCVNASLFGELFVRLYYIFNWLADKEIKYRFPVTPDNMGGTPFPRFSIAKVFYTLQLYVSRTFYTIPLESIYYR